jgi:hypothetical protein
LVLVLAALGFIESMEGKLHKQRAMLVQIVRCIHMKSALTTIDEDPTLNFWRLIHGGFLDLAVLGDETLENWSRTASDF